MPGVLNSSSHCGINREVGKMAVHMDPDVMTSVCITGYQEDIFDSLFGSSCQFLLESAESDCDLPDNEHPVDLIKYLDSEDQDMEHKHNRIKCEEGCNICTASPGKYIRYQVSGRKDPFMGMVSSEHCDESVRPSTSVSVLGQSSSANYDSESDEVVRQKMRDAKTFIAWSTPKSEDEPDFLLSKSSIGWHGLFEDETSVTSFPETPSPSAQSGTISGDDSDVDIETVTETPKSADTGGSSSVLRPSASPEPICKIQNGSLLSIASKAAGSSTRKVCHSPSLLTSKSVTSQNVHKTSSMALAENITTNRSHLPGHKRKLAKDKKLSKAQAHSVYTHVLCNSNSVNFHDYAMSPGACTYTSSPSSSTETGRPTVMSKRIYKRQIPVDATEKEKQHHHNQLERNRRQKLADLFIDLRDEVPRIASQAKASKVLILNEATMYIRDLQRRDEQQEVDISRELRRKDQLQNQLRRLRAQLSSGVK